MNFHVINDQLKQLNEAIAELRQAMQRFIIWWVVFCGIALASLWFVAMVIILRPMFAH